MPTLYETLIGAPPEGVEETQATARKLRGRQELGMLGMLTGDKVLSGLGQGMMGQTQKRTEGLQKSRQQKIANDRLLAQQDDLMGYRGTTSAETERHNRAMEKLRDEQTKAAARKLNNKIPPATVQRDARSMVDSALYTRSLLDSFKDDYGAGMAGIIGGGSVERFLGGTALKPESQDMAKWWKDYDRLYTLPTRNKMFGSALTEHEKAAWEAANISANSPPELIRQTLKDLSKIAADASARMEGDLRTIYSNPWVDEAFSHSVPDDDARPNIDETANSVPTSSQGFEYEVLE